MTLRPRSIMSLTLQGDVMAAIETYLEQAKLEELERQYRSKGYEVDLPKRKTRQDFDLVARGQGRRIAVEVRARSQLKESAREIAGLRELAQAQGFDEFRLVIVNPPRASTTEVIGLDAILAKRLSEDVPEELRSLASNVVVEQVDSVQLEQVMIRPDRIHVVGTASVEVLLEYGGGAEGEGYSAEQEFPLDFDLELNGDLRVEAVPAPRISVDVSSFAE